MIIDGKKIADEILAELKQEIKQLNFKPKLIDVLVGEDPVIETYVRIKAKRSEEIGLAFEIKRFAKDIKQEDLDECGFHSTTEISHLSCK
jgi:5,10-methylene-tetrahydrofolate dehydrogenase/methenyl tetrahydrofolate cyclohydrolase